MTTAGLPRSLSPSVAPWLLWVGGIGLGLLAVGWPFGGGLLLELDLIAIGSLDAPESLLGMGTEIPRRAPFQAILAVVSPPLAAATVTRLFMIAVVATAAVGMTRALPETRIGVGAGAGVLYALSPFLLTRLAVGHLGFALAVALIPWAAPTLLDPGDTNGRAVGRRALLWLSAFALCGYFGILIAGPMLVVGIAASGRPLKARDIGLAILTQLPWLLPAATALGAASGGVGSASFRTDVHTVADAVRLLMGFGFWRAPNQLGQQGVVAVAAALVFVMLAAVGLRFGSTTLRWRTLVLAAAGFAVAVASAIPGVDDAYDNLTDFVVFAPIREGQRLLAFAVYGLVLFAARGVDALLTERPPIAATVAFVAASAVALVISGSALLGLDGAAEAHVVPETWDRVAEEIAADPGPTLALPWSQYFDVAIADDTRGHHPVPFLVSGDVLYRHDLGLGAATTVGRDPREDDASTLVRALRFGEPVESLARDLGLMWVVALPDLDDGDDIERLRASETFDAVLDEPTIALFRGPGGPQDRPNPWGPVPGVIAALDLAWAAVVGAAGLRRLTKSA